MVNLTKGYKMKLKLQLKKLLKKYHKTFDCFGNRRKTK